MIKKLDSLAVKKVIALSLVTFYILLTAYDTVIHGKPISESFVTACTMVIAYYFGRSHGKEEQNNGDN